MLFQLVATGLLLVMYGCVGALVYEMSERRMFPFDVGAAIGLGYLFGVVTVFPLVLWSEGMLVVLVCVLVCSFALPYQRRTRLGF